MKYLAIILMIGVITVGVFGFVDMINVHNSHSFSCIADKLDNTPCAPKSDLVSSAIHHLQAYSSYMNAFLIFSLAIMFFIIVSRVLSLYPKIVSLYRLSNKYSNILFHKILIRRWLSLFENSPSLA